MYAINNVVGQVQKRVCLHTNDVSVKKSVLKILQSVS